MSLNLEKQLKESQRETAIVRRAYMHERLRAQNLIKLYEEMEENIKRIKQHAYNESLIKVLKPKNLIVNLIGIGCMIYIGYVNNPYITTLMMVFLFIENSINRYLYE